VTSGVVADRELDESERATSEDLIPTIAQPLGDGERFERVGASSRSVTASAREGRLQRQYGAEHIRPVRVDDDLVGLEDEGACCGPPSRPVLDLREVGPDLPRVCLLSLIELSVQFAPQLMGGGVEVTRPGEGASKTRSGRRERAVVVGFREGRRSLENRRGVLTEHESGQTANGEC
jgi:hypothetical protein